MAVRTTTVTGNCPASAPVRTEPIRTCVGCRQKAAASELLRVVVAPAVSRTPAGSADVLVVPDPRRRAAGRGAWVHRVPECVEQALRRRAFVRAFRLPPGCGVDPGAVAYYVAEYGKTKETPDRTSS